MIERPAWHARANCGRNGIIGDDPEVRLKIMFSRHAERVCEGCPVSDQCGTSANLTPGRLYGTWAGTEMTGRQKVMRCTCCGDLFEPSTSASKVCSEVCRVENVRRISRLTSRRARGQVA